MSTTTTNLGLFEYDPVADANNTYNITTALNDNWDKIDSATGKLSTLTTTEKSSLVGAINEVNSKDSLPSQTGQSGKFLTTDGTNASWSGITGGAEITYADNTTADLETVKFQTTATYEDRTSFPNTQMDVVEDIGDSQNPLYFVNAKTISASTSYTYSQNGTFCTGSTSVATVTITDTNNNSVTIYGNIVRIPRGCTFTSSVAGKFYFDDNYYGYLAN